MAPSSQLTWYYNRLRAMSAAEIMHRITEATKRILDKHCKPCRLKDYGLLPEIPGLKEKLRSTDISQEMTSNWRKQATNAQSGNFFMLGQHWPQCPASDKWHLDPVTSTFWPKDIYCFAIDYRNPENKGDVKLIWELNRLQYLQPIAALAFKTSDESLARFALNEIESWIDNNPPHKGINWACGIELALRVTSMMFVISLTSDFITTEQHKKIWASLREHAFWIARYPSRFSSANNHLTAEGLGLFLAGALCPKLPRARTYKKRGWEMLLDTAEKQILDDGAGAEQSPTYTAIVVEMLLFALHITDALKLPVPESYTHKIAHAGEYLRWFIDAGGNTPHIGDDDNACVIGAYDYDSFYVSSVTACVAARFARPDITPPYYTPQLRNLLFGSPPASSPPIEAVHTFEKAGYTVGRHLAHGREVWLAVDHGYLGYLSIAAHGHADALSLWLHLDGNPVLVDSGTYCYHSGGSRRDYFRGTLAHNSLCMEHADSSIPSGSFNWSHKANASRTSLETGAHHWQIDATHDGYLKRFGAMHRRRVSLTPLRGFTVEDSITGTQLRHVRINFLLHPSVTATAHGKEARIMRDGKLILQVRHLSALALSIHHLDGKSDGYSPSFGVLQPATRISFEGMLAPNAKAVTDFTFHWPT